MSGISVWQSADDSWSVVRDGEIVVAGLASNVEASKEAQCHDRRQNWKSSDAELRTGPDLPPFMPPTGLRGRRQRSDAAVGNERP